MAKFFNLIPLFQYLWKKSGLESRVPIITVNLDPRSDEVRKDREKLLKVYRTVPRDLFVRIYRKYQPDFELFGYDIDETLRSVGYEPLTDEERALRNFG